MSDVQQHDPRHSGAPIDADQRPIKTAAKKPVQSKVRKVKRKPEPAAVAQSNSKPADKNVVRVGKPSSQDMKEIGGSDFELWNTQMLTRTYTTFSSKKQAGDADETAVQHRIAATAALALHAFEPKNEVEAMLAGQATMLHAMSMECARRAMIPDQHPDVASKLRKDACNAARSMVEMTEALQRRRGKQTRQVVRVEKVMVAPGGQAAVGNFGHGGQSLPMPEPQMTALSQPEMVGVERGVEDEQ